MTVAVGGGLAVAWLAAWWVNLHPPIPSDQLNYLRAAAHFPWSLHSPTTVQQYTRYGLVVPVRLVMEIFGYSEATYFAVPLLASLLLLLATYALGTLLFSRVVGAVAAAVLMTATTIIRDSSELLPDILATALVTTAVTVCVAVALRRLPTRWPVLLLIGFLLGWGYLVREFVVFLWPLIPLLLWRRVGWRGLVWVAAPMVVLFAAEAALCWGVYGDPLTRVKAVLGHGQAPSPERIARTYRNKPRLVYVQRLPRRLGEDPGGAGLRWLLTLTVVGGLGQLAVLAARLRRGGRPPRLRGSVELVILAMWCALLWVPLTLLGGVIDPAAPKLRLQLIRYWFPIFPAFVLGGVAVVWLVGCLATRRLAGRAGPTRLAAAAPTLAVLVVAVALAAPAVRGWWPEPAGLAQLAAFRDWMSRHGQAVPTVWTDDKTDDILRVYQSDRFGGRAWSAEIATLRPGGPRPRSGDMVVLFDAQAGVACGWCRQAMERLLGAPPVIPSAWRPLFQTTDGIVRVYGVR